MSPITQLQPSDFTGRLLNQGDVVIVATGRGSLDYGIVVSYDKKVGHVLRLLRANYNGDYCLKQTVTSDSPAFDVYIVEYKSKSVPCPVMQAINGISEPFNLVKDKPVIQHTPDEFLHRFYRSLTKECRALKKNPSRYRSYNFTNKYNDKVVYSTIPYTNPIARVISLRISFDRYNYQTTYTVNSIAKTCITSSSKTPFLIDGVPVDPIVVRDIVMAEIYA